MIVWSSALEDGPPSRPPLDVATNNLCGGTEYHTRCLRDFSHQKQGVCVMHSWRSRKVRVLTHIVLESVVSGFFGEGELQSSEEEERHCLHCTISTRTKYFCKDFCIQFISIVHHSDNVHNMHGIHDIHDLQHVRHHTQHHISRHGVYLVAMFLNVSALLMLTLAMPAGQKKLKVRQLARQLGGSFPSFHVEKGLSGRHLSVGRQIEVTYDSFKNK